MTRWVAVFENGPQDEVGWVRREHAEEHFAYLADHPEIVLAGGLRPMPDEWYDGGLWVLEVDSRARAVELVEADPFYVLGLRRGYRLHVWGKAPVYGDVTL